MASLSLDYAARQKAGSTSLKYYYVKQFPVLTPADFSLNDLAFITPRVLELTYTSHLMRFWAEDLGYVGLPFSWDETRRALLRAEIDAFFARKYEISREDLRYLLEPADVKVANYPSETFRVLKSKERRLYQEYRTQRLVLAAFDKLTGG